MPNDSALSLRLRSLRNGTTQRDVADLLGVSAALVSAWESGVVPPQARLRQLAAIFAPDRPTVLLEELMKLRELAGPPGQPPDTTVIDLLQDIRWLLVQIRDRLPERD